MNKLKDKKIIVLGGTGGVGEGLVKSFLSQGADVIVLSRNQQKIDALKEYVSDIQNGKLFCLIASIDKEENILELQDLIKSNFGEIDVVVASLGGWHQGFLLKDYPMDSWLKILNDNLTSHFMAIKIFVPLLNKNGKYIHINGMGSEQHFPKAAPVLMAAAAQRSLILTLAEELKLSGQSAYEMILGFVNTRERAKHIHQLSNLYTPIEIGDYIGEQIIDNNSLITTHYLKSK
ncbi:MAG: SDR family oxidoreductase [Chloroflexia bacterium]|nr:SDR family oxidoreductase [Chloroflexia bacterium]